MTYSRFAQAWDLTKREANWALAREAGRSLGSLPSNAARQAEATAAIRARLLNDQQRRDMRRTGMVQMALAGATTPQIATLTGWRINHAQTIPDTDLPGRGKVALGEVGKREADTSRVMVVATKRS